MRKYVLGAAAVAALGSTAPATAQGRDILQQGLQALLGGGGINNRLANLENEIRASFDRQEISRNQASRLQRELDDLREMERSFARNGPSRSERVELQHRLERLERRLEQARYEGDGRFGRDDRFDDNRDSDEGDDEGGDDEGDDEGGDDEGDDEGDDDEGDDDDGDDPDD